MNRHKILFSIVNKTFWSKVLLEVIFKNHCKVTKQKKNKTKQKNIINIFIYSH